MLIILIVVLVLLFGGGGGYYYGRGAGWGGPHYGGGLLGLVLMILLILWLTGNIGGGLMMRSASAPRPAPDPPLTPHSPLIAHLQRSEGLHFEPSLKPRDSHEEV